MSIDGEDFVLNQDSLAELWSMALREEIGITFQVDPKDSKWLTQNLYRIRRDYANPALEEITLHLNSDQQTVLMYKRSQKDPLP